MNPSVITPSGVGFGKGLKSAADKCAALETVTRVVLLAQLWALAAERY